MLKDRDCQRARPNPDGTVRRLSDAHGLFLQIHPHPTKPEGVKYWRFQYTFGAKRNTISLGVYPAITLKAAREAHLLARQAVMAGTDPSHARRTVKDQTAVTFTSVAEKWLEHLRPTWSPRYYSNQKRRVENYLTPTLGRQPIATITAEQITNVLESLEAEVGNCHLLHRVAFNAKQILRYAVRKGRAPHDVTHVMRGALVAPEIVHRARVDEPEAVGRLLAAIDAMPKTAPQVRAALQMVAYTFVRSSELRNARWEEFDLDGTRAAEWRLPTGLGPMWRIPGARMKKTRGFVSRASMPDHFIPLAPPVVTLLRNLRARNIASPFVFASVHKHTSQTGVLSEGTMNHALGRIGYTGKEQCVHGFRGIAGTLLRDPLRFASDLVELQLAHKFKDGSRAPYDSAKFLVDRVAMMSRWAEYLDDLKTTAAKQRRSTAA